MTSTLAPKRLTPEMFELGKSVYRKRSWVKVMWPVTHGYHARPIDIPTDDYSVIRQVDARGPEDKVAAFDVICAGTRMMSRFVKLSRHVRSCYLDMYDGRIGPWNLAELSGPTDNHSITGFVHGRPGISHIHPANFIHVAIRRDMVSSQYVMDAILSVFTGEELSDWENR